MGRVEEARERDREKGGRIVDVEAVESRSDWKAKVDGCDSGAPVKWMNEMLGKMHEEKEVVSGWREGREVRREENDNYA